MADFDERYPEDVHPIATKIGNLIAFLINKFLRFFGK